MLDLVEKSIKKIQLKDISMEYLCQFYSKEVNRKKIILIYDNEDYYTNVSYQEIAEIYDEKELIYFLMYLCREKSVKISCDAIKSAERIFAHNPNIRYVLVVENTEIESKALFYTDVVVREDLYKESMNNIKRILRKEGIHTYLVRIPQIEDIEEKAKHPEWTLGHLSAKINWSEARESEIKRYLDRFTELKYVEYRNKFLKGEGEEKRKIEKTKSKMIYLVGPCIVGGWETLYGDTLCNVLNEKLDDAGLDFKAVKVVTTHYYSANMKAILEYDIRKNDIVIMLDSIFDREVADIQLDYIYNNYRGYKWMYSDMPIHTTRMGNELIANELISNIVKPIAIKCDKFYDGYILHHQKKQLSYEDDDLLHIFLEGLSKYREKYNGVIGACVMTCNPFTKGHYHLIEYASRQVDILYVFVVEEDAFFFSFEDRLKMVRGGIMNLSNVVVMPSGKFIISKGTFRNYFEKEEYPEAFIDAEKDIMFFKDYISPALGICKRFVGEENTDKVTEQYNQLLKRDLSKVMDVIEIPRIRHSGEVISASKVRHCFEMGDWEEIEKMVPDSTLEYLKKICSRLNERRVQNPYINKIEKYIKSHSKVVVCGLGENWKRLIPQLERKLKKEDIEKLEYYDQKAAQMDYYYRGKKVITFDKLVQEYKDYGMLITTSVFHKDIFYSMIKDGIDSKQIMIIYECV